MLPIQQKMHLSEIFDLIWVQLEAIHAEAVKDDSNAAALLTPRMRELRNDMARVQEQLWRPVRSIRDVAES